MKPFDVDAVLTGTVEEISASLANHNREQLTALAEAEGKRDGGGRSSLLAAIDAAKVNAAPAPTPAAPPTESGSTTTAKIDSTAKANAAPKTKNDTPAAAKAKAPAKSKAASKAKPVSAERAGALKIDRDAGDLRPLLEYHESATIIMADVDGVPLKDWPPLEFAGAEFEDAPAGALLKQSVEMGIELPRGDVCSVWLLVGGTPVGVVRLSAPLAAGGGRKAEFPANSLRFRTDD